MKACQRRVPAVFLREEQAASSRSSAEQLDALAGQLRGGTHHLVFGFGRTGSGYHDGAFYLGILAEQIHGSKVEFHIYNL